MSTKQYMRPILAAQEGGLVHNIGLKIRPLSNPLAVWKDQYFIPPEPANTQKTDLPKIPDAFVETTIASVGNFMNEKLSNMQKSLYDGYETMTPSQLQSNIVEYNKQKQNLQNQADNYQLKYDKYSKDVSSNKNNMSGDYAISDDNKVYIYTRGGVKKVNYSETKGKKILTNQELDTSLRTGLISYDDASFANDFDSFFSTKLSIDDVHKKINNAVRNSGETSIKVDADSQNITLTEKNGQPITFGLTQNENKENVYSATTGGGLLNFNDFGNFIGGEVTQTEMNSVNKHLMGTAIRKFNRMSQAEFDKEKESVSKATGVSIDKVSDSDVYNRFVQMETSNSLQDMLFSSITTQGIITNANDEAIKNTKRGKQDAPGLALTSQKEQFKKSSDTGDTSVSKTVNIASYALTGEDQKAGNWLNSGYSKFSSTANAPLTVYGTNQSGTVAPEDVWVSEVNDLNIITSNVDNDYITGAAEDIETIMNNDIKYGNKVSQTEKENYRRFAHTLHRELFLHKEKKLKNYKTSLIDKNGKLKIDKLKAAGIEGYGQDIYDKVNENITSEDYLSLPNVKDARGVDKLSDVNKARYNNYYKDLIEKPKMYEAYLDLHHPKIKDRLLKITKEKSSIDEMTAQERVDILTSLIDINKRQFPKTDIGYKLKKELSKTSKSKLTNEYKTLSDSNVKIAAVGYDLTWMNKINNNLSKSDSGEELVERVGTTLKPSIAYDALRGSGLTYVKNPADVSKFRNFYDNLEKEDKINILNKMQAFVQDSELYDMWHVNDTDLEQLTTDEEGSNNPSVYTFATLKKIGNLIQGESINQEEFDENSQTYNQVIDLMGKILPAKLYISEAANYNTIKEKLASQYKADKGAAFTATKGVIEVE